ncbi:MAG: hypothetical protein KME67_08875 [Candidatus Thiodiazotropha sp. (ex Codakia orbicularis)]|nr:hypothetical protein [Candidatus Thiodiazotropha sp. (ex Codakia orbicularis)]
MDEAIAWLAERVEDPATTEPAQMTELVMIELGAGDWLIIENETETPVTHKGAAFATIADILSGPEGSLHLYDYGLSVDSLRKNKRRVVDRLNNCGAGLMAEYIDRNLGIHNNKTITVRHEPGVFFTVSRINP